MPLISTPAIVLSSLRYGETSKIVRLATRDYGVQSAIAKGAFRPRSRFGAALQLLSTGQAHLLYSERRDLHTLTGFEVASIPVGLAAEVSRFATGTALAEVMLRVAPSEPHPEAFEVLAQGLPRLVLATTDAVPALGLRLLWQLVASLGFAPVVHACARDGRPLESGEVAFSGPEGGALCGSCARTAEHVVLPAHAVEALQVLLDPSAELPDFDDRHAAAHRRLLARYVRFHLAEGASFPALEFWQQGAWSTR